MGRRAALVLVAALAIIGVTTSVSATAAPAAAASVTSIEQLLPTRPVLDYYYDDFFCRYQGSARMKASMWDTGYQGWDRRIHYDLNGQWTPVYNRVYKPAYVRIRSGHGDTATWTGNLAWQDAYITIKGTRDTRIVGYWYEYYRSSVTGRLTYIKRVDCSDTYYTWRD